MLALVIGAFLLGWLVKTIRPIPIQVTAWADKYVLQVALPAVIIAKISTVSFDADVVLPIAVAWSVMFASIVAILATSRILKWNRSITGALLLVGVLGNTSFLGLGMVESLLALITWHLQSHTTKLVRLSALHCGVPLLQVHMVLVKVDGVPF